MAKYISLSLFLFALPLNWTEISDFILFFNADDYRLEIDKFDLFFKLFGSWFVGERLRVLKKCSGDLYFYIDFFGDMNFGYF